MPEPPRRPDHVTDPTGPQRDPERRRLVHELFLALKRGYELAHCRSCETFYMMAKLCLDEGGESLTGEERTDAESWVEAGSILELDFGCEDACAVVPLYARLSR